MESRLDIGDRAWPAPSLEQSTRESRRDRRKADSWLHLIHYAGNVPPEEGAIMPVISMFYGIIVSMYFLDNRRHKRPHVHVRYQEHEVVLAIPDGEILEGSIPGNKLKLVLAWMEIHRDELLADWDLAAIGQQPYKIEPLK